MCKWCRLWQTSPVFNSRQPRREPIWRSPRQVQHLGLPPALHPWLLDQQSLTERLIDVSGGAFRVQRLSQSWQRPMPSEAQLLAIPHGQWALVREVALLCHEQPWVYARSVIPAKTLVGKYRRLRHLKNQSLGALLFQQSKLRREAFEVALLPRNSQYIHRDLRQEQTAWARRSCFVLSKRPLLVSEVFLEQFQAS
jgi:chorismate--pyruvate lyase